MTPSFFFLFCFFPSRLLLIWDLTRGAQTGIVVVIASVEEELGLRSAEDGAAGEWRRIEVFADLGSATALDGWGGRGAACSTPWT